MLQYVPIVGAASYAAICAGSPVICIWNISGFFSLDTSARLVCALIAFSLLQVDPFVIASAEGVRGFFAGLSATIAQAPPSTAVYFLTYETAKHTGQWLTEGRNENLVFFCAGASSELFASVLFVPLEVAKSRLQLGSNPHRATGGILQSHTNFPGISSALHGVYRERGVSGLMAGWKSGLVQDMAFSATQFLAYERMKAQFEKKAGGRPASTRETLLSGCVAGGLAAAVTNPLDVVTSRLMVQDGRTGYGRGMAAVWTATVAEGPAALWRGTIPRVAQTAPLSAISFAVYEAIRRWFAADETRRKEYAQLVGSTNPFTGNS